MLKSARSRKLAAATALIPLAASVALSAVPAFAADDDGRIEGAMLSGAISTAVMHPLVGDIDDETLRTKLTDMSRRLLNLRVDGDG